MAPKVYSIPPVDPEGNYCGTKLPFQLMKVELFSLPTRSGIPGLSGFKKLLTEEYLSVCN